MKNDIKRNIKPIRFFTIEELEEALVIAATSSKSICDALYAAGEEAAAGVAVESALSFERVFRAALRISEGRGGRPSIKKER